MRYEVFAHPEKAGWFLVSDIKWMMELEFEVHKFNDTQKIVTIGRLAGRSATEVARAMRELGDHMATEYPEIVR